MQQAQLTAQSSTPHKRPSLVVYCDGEERKRHRKVSSKLATTCAEETAAQEQKDVSKQSQVHIEHVKQSVKSSHYLSATGPNSTGSMPPQFIINSSPPLPTGYQLPTQQELESVEIRMDSQKIVRSKTAVLLLAPCWTMAMTQVSAYYSSTSNSLVHFHTDTQISSRYTKWTMTFILFQDPL